MIFFNQKTQQGFTLIELVVSIVLMGIISVVISKILLQGYQTFIITQNISEIDWQGFLSLSKMTDDIRNIRSSADITVASPSQFSFVDMNANTIQYQLSGITLLRNSQLLASGIQGLTFSYLDKNGLATSTLSAIRYISLSIAFTQGDLTQTFSTTSATRGMP